MLREATNSTRTPARAALSAIIWRNPVPLAVVHMGNETRFSARPLPQSAFGGTGWLGLQSSPQLPVPPAHIGDLRAGVAASIRIARPVRYPPIHSQIVIHSLWFSHIDVRGGCQLESLAVSDQVALTRLPLQPGALSLPALQWHPAPASHPPQPDGLGSQIPRQYALIVGESPIPSGTSASRAYRAHRHPPAWR